MKTIITSTNLELKDEFKKYLDQKIGETVRKFRTLSENDSTELRIELGLPSTHHKSGRIYYAEVNLSVAGELLRADSEDFDLKTAIDKVKGKLHRLIKKYLDKSATRSVLN